MNALKRNLKTGKMRFVEAEVDGQGGVAAMDGPRDVKVSPDGKNVYVTATSNTVLTEFDSLLDDQGNAETLGRATEVVASPDGAHLYVSAGSSVTSDDDAVTAVVRDEKLKLKLKPNRIRRRRRRRPRCAARLRAASPRAPRPAVSTRRPSARSLPLTPLGGSSSICLRLPREGPPR